MIGSETNIHKSAAFDLIASVDRTPNGRNIAVRIVRPTRDRDGVQTSTTDGVAFVLLTRGEAESLISALRREIDAT